MLALRRVLPRAVSRSARPLTSSAQKLSVLLKEEWDDEQRSAGVSERLGVLIGGLQAKGGSIRDESGSAVVSITLRDGVVASFDCRDVLEETDDSIITTALATGEHDHDEAQAVEFDVTVPGDGGSRVVFECVAQENVQIDAVAFYGAAADAADDALYDGPKFDELDARRRAARRRRRFTFP